MTDDHDLVRAEILALGDDVLARAKTRGATETVDRLDGALRRLRSGKLVVVVCGEHKQGKSRLLNALLDEPDLLTVDSFFATRLVTTIAHGPAEHIEVVFDDGGTKVISRADIAAYTAEREADRPPDAHRARRVDIRLPHPRLASGLTFVDTPGVGGVFHEHTEATMAFLPAADAVLFVSTLGEPLLPSELDFLVRAADAVHAADRADALLFVLTKSDRKSDPIERRLLLAAARERLAKATGRDPADIVLCAVSATSKERAGRTGNANFLAASGFPDLEAAIWAQLARHGAKVLLGGTLGIVNAAVDNLVRPLRDEETARRNSGSSEIADLTARLDADTSRLTELDRDGAGWRAELKTGLREMGRKLGVRAEQGLDKVWRRAEQDYLAQECYLVAPAKLARELGTEIALVVGAVNEWGAQRAAALQRELVSRSGLAVTTMFDVLPPPRVLDLDAYGTLRPRTSRRWIDTSSYRSTGRTYYTGVRGAAVEIADVFGMGDKMKGFIRNRFHNESTLVNETRWEESGYWDERDDGYAPDELAARRDALAKALREDRERFGADVAESITALLDQFRAGTTAEMESLITQERERIADTLPRLRAALTASREDTAARITALIAEQQPLDEATDQIAWLRPKVQHLERHYEAPR
jgi:Dynamin family